MIHASDTPVLVSNNVTGTAYTFSRTDAGRVIEANSASAQTLTIPLVSVVGWAVGTVLQVYQQGAGQVTIAGAIGVTLRSAGTLVKTNTQYSVITLRMRANDEWVLSGDRG